MKSCKNARCTGWPLPPRDRRACRPPPPAGSPSPAGPARHHPWSFPPDSWVSDGPACVSRASSAWWACQGGGHEGVGGTSQPAGWSADSICSGVMPAEASLPLSLGTDSSTSRAAAAPARPPVGPPRPPGREPARCRVPRPAWRRRARPAAAPPPPPGPRPSARPPPRGRLAARPAQAAEPVSRSSSVSGSHSVCQAPAARCSSCSAPPPALPAASDPPRAARTAITATGLRLCGMAEEPPGSIQGSFEGPGSASRRPRGLRRAPIVPHRHSRPILPAEAQPRARPAASSTIRSRSVCQGSTGPSRPSSSANRPGPAARAPSTQACPPRRRTARPAASS